MLDLKTIYNDPSVHWIKVPGSSAVSIIKRIMLKKWFVMLGEHEHFN